MKEALETAKTRQVGDGTVTLSTGVRVRLHPVAPGLLSDAATRVKYPKPPMWLNPEKEREEPNYNDPDYLEAVRAAQSRINEVTLDAVILFGVEIVGGLPEDGHWLKQLQFLEKRGVLDLSDYDLGDDMEREFLYKRHIAVSKDDIVTISRMSGLTQEEVETAGDTFPGTA